MSARTILNTSYDSGKRWHNACLLLVVVFCLILCTPVLRNADGNIAYPLDDVGGHIAYVQQFDAFMKGQTYIDVLPDESLAELDNPYSPDQREGIPYLWDRAYYDGYYYSYFGIAPIFTVYFPYFAVFGALPSAVTVCFILACFSVIFTALAFRELVIRICPDANLWLLLAALFGVIFGGGVYLGLSWPDNYYIAVLSAIQSSMAAIFFAMRAMRSERRGVSAVLLVLAAIFLTLSVWSRPSAAVMCLAIAPFLLEYFIRIIKKSTRDGLSSVLPFGIVLLFGAGAVMYFNAIRFSSPLDFGANYQLTVSDISENTISLALFDEAMRAYFLQPPALMQRFPFFTKSYMPFESAGRYIYTASTVGAVFFGLPFASACGALTAWWKKNRTAGIAFLSTIILSIFLAFADFCLGGVNLRYLLDFLPVLTVFSAVGLLMLHSKVSGWKKTVVAIVSLLLIITAVLMMLGIVLGNVNDRLF